MNIKRLTKSIDIFEFPTNLGLRNKDQDDQPGVRYLPEHLFKHGFHERLQPDRVIRLNAPNYSIELNNNSTIINANAVSDYAIEQANVLQHNLNPSKFNVIIGGDCSILIGTMLALKKKGNYGLFFLDGHTDFIGPELSQTGAIAGMDLAMATGWGPSILTNIDGMSPYIKEELVWCVGNRELDLNYINPVVQSNVNYFNLYDIRRIGASSCANEFLSFIEGNAEGFFIHLDVDVLSDFLMPSVDSRQPDGLNYHELSELLIPLFSSVNCIGIEITILDPSKDVNGHYSVQFIDAFISIIKRSLSSGK